jgi:hypothetical protein
MVKTIFAGEIAGAATQRQPGHAGRRDDAEGDGEAESLGGVVDIAGGELSFTIVDPSKLRFGVKACFPAR